MKTIKRCVLALGVILVILFGAFLVTNSLLQPTVTPPAALETYQASIEQGKYLATVGNCASCHTAERGETYAGGLAFKTDFGTLYSTNITPDKNTGIGQWSFEDFYRSIKEGLRPDGSHLYPAYPYTAFAKMSDDDIASLYLYLQTLQPVSANTPENELSFPYNLRPLLAFWKALFHDTSTLDSDPLQSAQWNRGAYLVEGPAHCGACHTPRNLLGAEIPEQALAGGVHWDKVKLGHYRQWSAVNLTPGKTGLANWTSKDIVNYLKRGQSDKAVVHGPMNEVIMNSTSQMSDTDLQAIASYLQNIPAKDLPPGPTPSEQTMAEGAVVYTVHCGGCHLPTGLGDPVLGVPLTNSAIVQAQNPASLINVILYGPHLPPPPFVVDRTRMKMFGKRMPDKDIASVTSYIRNSFGNRASVVSAQEVKAQR